MELRQNDGRRRRNHDEFPFNWLGLPASRTTLTVSEACHTIPAFAKRPFRVDTGVPLEAVNPYYDVIVRLPTDEYPTEVPVGLVSKNYQLVQHHEILQRAASMLASQGIDLNQIEVNLDLTVHGERMNLGLQLPTYSKYSFSVRPGDIVALYLEFINSVDGSLRLALRVSWLRLLCRNGLTTREVLSTFSRTHIGGEILQEFEDHLPSTLLSVTRQKKLFEEWIKTEIAEEAFEAWIENTVRTTWGLKAAVRTYHIARRGIDVNIQRMVPRTRVKWIETKDKAPVTGALTNSLNVFAISQALTWLAGDRGEFQEQLDWKSQVYEMVAKLLPEPEQQRLFPLV